MRVLVVAAHPDDEILGVAGAVAKHLKHGDEVISVVVSEGASSRYESGKESILREQGRNAAKVVGLSEIKFLGLRDQYLDAKPIIELTKPIEGVIQDFKPEVVYTHFAGDLNRDHRMVCEAVMVASRPVGSAYPKRVLSFETPSSTEWNVPGLFPPFQPNFFIDITQTIEKKLKAMACYELELRPAPHPRSIESLRSRAQYWGQIAGVPYAEAFCLLREIR